MENISPYVPDLLRLVKRTYPDWNSFNDPDFVEDETAYKREASQLAEELLSKDALEGLLAAGNYDEFINRLRKVAAKTNLLFLGVPQKGDLALIRQPDTDPGPICHAVFDLLHGDGPSEKRLEAFFEFVVNNNLPHRWPFPTYYLYLLYPENEIFVKPRVMNWFSRELDGAVPYSSQPDAATYEKMRAAFHSLRDELVDYDARDMIDIQSFVWVASRAAQKSTAFDKAIELLRIGLGEIENFEDMVENEEYKDGVIGRYGTMFSVDHLPQLTAEEFTSFLRYENNRHWSGINRYGSRIVQDMPKLRQALTALQDESRPIAERFDEFRESVKGLGKAVLTPILLVTHPDHYGVWNGKQIAAFQQLKIHPEVSSRDSEGAQYAEINALLNELADELGVDLWTLDILWEWVTRQSTLAEPFATIYEDRDQAEWAFDFFAETVDRLGGDENDQRFAMTIRHGDSMQRLNFGNWMLLDISQSRGVVDLALLIEPMESQFQIDHWGAFAKDDAVAVFEIPIETMREWSPELQSIYEASMDHIAEHFRNWKRTPYGYAHRDEIFQALFDEEKRGNLLSKGLKPPDREKRYWRITLPTDVRREMEEDRRTFDLWQACLQRGMAVIDFDDDPESPQIARFAQIESGDRVVAFLRNKTIGGIGEVIAPLDERVAQERPGDHDYFYGHNWLRIGVDWKPKMISVDSLPANVRNKFGQQTVIEMGESEFEAVEIAIAGDLINSDAGAVVANEFGGFTADSFAFLRELSANNNKEWMEQNRDRWKDSVREPMRALFTDLGPLLKPKFDPFLVPDALEITPSANKVLARISKNWGHVTGSQYHDYYWGAFYREKLTKQTDAQLFVNMQKDVLRFGFYLGEMSKTVREQFRKRIENAPNSLLSLINGLDLRDHFEFVRTDKTGVREKVAIDTASDLLGWSDTGDFDLLTLMTPEEVVDLGPAVADRVYEAMRRVFPIYLWAVVEDPEQVVERYLAAEFPITGEDEDEELEAAPEPYGEDEFVRDTYLTREVTEELLELLEDRRQAIFFGPPGTGKTYVARHLGKLITSLAEPPAERMEIIQFHPAYSYEDFIEGIRPESKHVDGRHLIDYPALPGVFVRFCRRAQSINEPCVFIIDEINRGNIARIFGELMLLLEYRDQDVPLPYSGKRFRIPENVYIIGTMNTADRSIALVDFALRRRFHFFHFAADPDLFDRWLDANPATIPYLGELYRRLSQEAVDDHHFAVGPSYFMRDDLTERKLERIWRRSILPYLQEYYFDQEAKAQRWEWDSEFMRGIRGNLYGS